MAPEQKSQPPARIAGLKYRGAKSGTGRSGPVMAFLPGLGWEFPDMFLSSIG
jgi:hypothetical protein